MQRPVRIGTGELSVQAGTARQPVPVRMVEPAVPVEPNGPVEPNVPTDPKVRIGTVEPLFQHPTAAPRELPCHALAPLHPLARPADHRCARRCGVAAAFLVRWSIYALSVRLFEGVSKAPTGGPSTWELSC